MRKWLKHNKVFFEIFSYMFLGLASIVVGIMTWKTGQRELELSEIDREPVINLQVDRNSERKPISVYNDGYHLFEPMIFIKSVFQIKQHIPGFQNKYYHFTVNDYYVETPETGRTRGEIVSKPLHKLTVGQIDRIEEDLKKISERENTRLEFNEFVFVAISYEDINQNFIDKIFIVDDYVWETSSSHFNLILGKLDEEMDASQMSQMNGDTIFQRLNNKNTIPDLFTFKMVSEESNSEGE